MICVAKSNALWKNEKKSSVCVVKRFVEEDEEDSSDIIFLFEFGEKRREERINSLWYFQSIIDFWALFLHHDWLLLYFFLFGNLLLLSFQIYNVHRKLFTGTVNTLDFGLPVQSID